MALEPARSGRALFWAAWRSPPDALIWWRSDCRVAAARSPRSHVRGDVEAVETAAAKGDLRLTMTRARQACRRWSGFAAGG
jgi:hypothetical protein